MSPAVTALARVAALAMAGGSLLVLLLYLASWSTARWIERLRHPRRSCRINDEPDHGAPSAP